MKMTAPKKTLYHSELVKMGVVKVHVKSDVLDSKFKKDQRYVELVIDGYERSYTAENDECADFFDGQKGRTFTIQAEGSREDATITYVGEAAEESEEQPESQNRGNKAAAKTPRPPSRPPGKRAPAAQEAAREPAPKPPANPERKVAPSKAPVETPEQRLARARGHAAKVANLWLVAYAAANYVREQVRAQFGQEVPETLFQGCVGTIAIQLERDGFHHQMPVGLIAAGKGNGSAKPKPEVAHQESDNDGGNV